MRSKSFRPADEIGQPRRPHLLHHVASIELRRLLGNAEAEGNAELVAALEAARDRLEELRDEREDPADALKRAGADAADAQREELTEEEREGLDEKLSEARQRLSDCDDEYDEDGWNKVRAERFDLVISDIDMPRMNGLEFVRRIRDDHGMKDLPVVIVSYKDRDEDRLRGLEVGASSYLTKSSFHDHTFLDAVESLIGKA